MSQSQTTSQENALATAPIGKLLFSLAVPAITAQVVNMLYNIVDRIYIGHIPEIGTAALTGVGITFPIITLISAFSSLIAMGGAPRASIAMGAHHKERAEEIMGNCFTALLALSVALTAVFQIFQEPILWAFGASENTIGYAMDYMGIYVWGTVFVQISLGMNMFITSQGFAKTSMLTVIIGAALNILLDPVFIFVFDMGVRGRGHCHGVQPGGFGGVGAAVPLWQAHHFENPPPVHGRPLEGAAACVGAGGLPLYHAEHREPAQRGAEHLSAQVRRGHRCGRPTR